MTRPDRTAWFCADSWGAKGKTKIEREPQRAGMGRLASCGLVDPK